MYFSSLDCCGIKELADIYTEDGHPEKMVKLVNTESLAFVVFSDINDGDDRNFEAGEALAAYIAEHNLGTVVAAGQRENPNSGNQLRAWLWNVDKGAMTAWNKGPGKKVRAPKW